MRVVVNETNNKGNFRIIIHAVIRLAVMIHDAEVVIKGKVLS